MDIYSGNRSEINHKITDKLNEKFQKAYGIEVLDASIIDAHPDDTLKKAINDRVKALQEKQQAEAEQQKIKVEKETELMQAKADAEIKKAKAEADADVVVTKAEAEAKANKKIAESITPELIKMKEAEARLKHGWVTTISDQSMIIKEESK